MIDSEVIRRAIESRIGDVFTALVGVIEDYQAATQTATIRVVSRRPIPDGDGETVWEDLPLLPNVPVLFPRAGAFSITWPIAKGDNCLVIVLTLAIASWRRSGAVTDAGDERMNHLGNAIAIPGLAPNANVLSSATINAMVLSGADVRLGNEFASDYVALASKVLTELQRISSMFSAWTPVSGDGGAALKTLSSSLVFSSPAATKVKAI